MKRAVWLSLILAFSTTVVSAADPEAWRDPAALRDQVRAGRLMPFSMTLGREPAQFEFRGSSDSTASDGWQRTTARYREKRQATVPDGLSVRMPPSGAVLIHYRSAAPKTLGVNECGAQGDGKQDDAPAIQKALDSGAAIVTIPAGTYRIARTLRIGSGTPLKADPQAVIRLGEVEDFLVEDIVLDHPVLRPNQDGVHNLAIRDFQRNDDPRSTQAAETSTSEGGQVFEAWFTPNYSGPDQAARKCPPAGGLNGIPGCTLIGDSGQYANQTFASRSKHSGGVNAVLCDGSVRFFSSSIAWDVWQALSSSRGSESLNNTAF